MRIENQLLVYFDLTSGRLPFYPPLRLDLPVRPWPDRP